MQLAKAIEILTIHNDHNPNFTDAERRAAHQLGIEALKLIKHGRLKPGGMFFHDLPGENSFIDTSHSTHAIKAVLESPLGREPRG